MKPWRQQRNAATAQRRTLLFQKPEPDIREPTTTPAKSERSAWEWLEWIEDHAEADRGKAISQVPAACRPLIVTYIKMRETRLSHER